MEKKYLESSEFYSKRFSNFSTIIIIPTALILLFTLLFLFFCKKEITVDGIGLLESKQKVLVIQSSSSNPVKKNYLKEGKKVHKNDTLLTYNSAIEQDELNYYIRQKKLLNEQKKSLVLLKKGILHNCDFFELDDAFGYRAELKDYLAQRAAISTSDDIVSPNNSSSVVKKKNLRLISLQMQKLNKVDKEQIEIEQQLQKISANIKETRNISSAYKIKAPKTGILHINDEYSNAQYIPIGSKIAEVYPLLNNKKTIQIKAYISPAKISSVKKGQKLRFKITHNTPKPIFINSKVKEVGIAPINIKKTQAYIVIASARVPSSINKILKYNVTGTVSIITGEETLINYCKDIIINKY